MEALRIVHFSDTLCTWAYVSQIRLDELLQNFSPQVEIETRFVNVFGDARGKIRSQWSEKGGIRAFAGHVAQVVEGFDHVSVHPEAWIKDTPQSSLPSHLALCAVRRLEEQGSLEPGATRRAAWTMRRAFFEDCVDISRGSALRELVQSASLPVGQIEQIVESGEAHAALSDDLELARELSVRSSPSLVLNQGRQKLVGNVGYGVIEANVRELLQGPSGQHSWC